MILPKKVWSQLGPVPVGFVKNLKQDDNKPDSAAYGIWDEEKRAISIDPASCHATQVQALFHEMTHVALSDAGMNPALSEQVIESICDAIGSYFAGSALAGYLTLRIPK